MDNPYNDIDALLAKQFAGETSPEEDQQIGAWLITSPDNEKYFADAQWLWEHVPEARESVAVDTEKALLKVKRHLKKPQTRIVSLRMWLTAAAAAVALVLAAVWHWHTPEPFPSEIMAGNTTPLTDTLSDGSVVSLNRNSGVVLAQQFNKQERRMRLRGEGYFKVTPDKSRPFVVEVNQLEVVVVGTEFNVDDQSIVDQIVVTVTEGKVMVKSTQQTEYVTPGQQAFYHKKTGKITVQTTPDPNVTAWKTRRFLFDETPLSTVAQQIGAVYGVKIDFANPALAQCRLSARYENLPLERVLNLIADTFGISVQRTGDQVIFNGAACGE